MICGTCKTRVPDITGWRMHRAEPACKRTENEKEIDMATRKKKRGAPRRSRPRIGTADIMQKSKAMEAMPESIAKTPEEINHHKEDQTMVKKKSTKAEKTKAQKGMEPKAPKKIERKDGTMSGLDAAAKVMAEAAEPLGCKVIVERAGEKGYWKPGGKTPAATMYSAILREIQKKGNQARFQKAARGLFALKTSP